MTQGEHFLEENMSKWIVPPLFYMPPTKQSFRATINFRARLTRKL